MNNSILIKNGHVVDPGQDIDGLFDILVCDGTVNAVVKPGEIKEEQGMKVIDATGLHVFPGFIDLHVHFREPGQEYKETIKTGAKAAAHGGFTTVCLMPNTNPVIDSPELVKLIVEKGKEASVNILPIAAVTKGQEGKELVDIKAVREAGAVALSEDGKSVMDPDVMRLAMEIARKENIPIFDHCEDKTKVNSGVMNKGKRSEELGLPGITNEVEDSIAERDIAIASETGAVLHLCHCSTERASNYISYAKQMGVRLTAETCPHYIALTDADIPEDNGNWKMNPPLRTGKDRDSLKEALKNGIIDVISTDHAPHSEEEKSKGFLKSPFGIVGLETAFPVCYTELVKNSGMRLPELIRRMSLTPAHILGIKAGTLKTTYPADITIADLNKENTVDPAGFRSKGRNTPFTGRKYYGEIRYTIVGGKIV